MNPTDAAIAVAALAASIVGIYLVAEHESPLGRETARRRYRAWAIYLTRPLRQYRRR